MRLSTYQVKQRLIRQALGRLRLPSESCPTLTFHPGQVNTRRTLTTSFSCLQLTTPTVKMATRRSARLSALAAAQPNDTAASILPPPAPAPKSRKRKVSVGDEEPSSTSTMEEPQLPSTPQKRKVSKKAAPPPATPTPAAASLLSSPAAGAQKKPKPAAVSRLADPNKTNAPLLSPQTSRVVSSSPIKPSDDTEEGVSPSKKPPQSQDSTTTENILEKACAHLITVDPRMKPLIDKHPCRIFSLEGLAEQIDPFESLVSSIISQQVSGAAAKSIKAKFVALFDDPDSPPQDHDQDQDGENGEDTPQGHPSESQPPNPKRRFPTPTLVLQKDLPTLRTAGLSQRKAEYIHGLAAKFVSGELSASLLASAPYDELVSKLVAVRGLGLWTVEMFACFALKRMDVFSLGDLGVQRGMAAFVGRDVRKLKNGNGKDKKWKYMSEGEMKELSERFRPYRSLFMWYMWRVEETDVSSME